MLHLDSVRQNLLRLFFGLIVGRENQQLYDSINWQSEGDRFRDPRLVYPLYYTKPDTHGISGGYLTSVAAVTYDWVTALASPPNEQWVRQQLISLVDGVPQRILDLGCGTGSSTVMLKRAFPTAQVTGLDLSPYMLIMAEQKVEKYGLAIALHHGLAEETQFACQSFDLITAAFLFHETPPAIAQAILDESFRLLKPGGQVLILDGRQTILRRTPWLIDLFREPYSKVYAAGCVDDWAKDAKFQAVKTESIGWIHQITTGQKPE